MGGALAAIGWLVLCPLFILFREGLRAPDSSFTLQNYVDVFTGPGLAGPAIDLVTEQEIAPDMIARIECWTHPRRLNHTDRPDPRSNLGAKFSVQYCVARGVVNRRVVLADFEGDAHNDTAVRAVMARLQAEAHPAMEMASEHFGAKVQLDLFDGRVLSRSTDRPLGRGPTKPLPRLEAKFLDCAGRALEPGAARRTLELIWRLDEIERVSELTGALCALAPTH